MKRWVILALLSIFLGCPLSVAADDNLPDSGRSSGFGLPMLSFPLGSEHDHGSAVDKKGENDAYAEKKKKEKQAEDKKIDDAIKKAWEEK